MNRSILIVICDFLLLSLLAFSTVDINKVTESGSAQLVQAQIVTNQVESGKDLTAVMRVALEEERKSRDLLLGELTKARETATQREQTTHDIQQQLARREQENTRLQQQQSALEQQFSAAQTNLQNLSQQLQNTSTISQEKLAAMEAELRKKAEQAAALQQQVNDLAKSNQYVLNERQRLAGQLQVAEVEKRNATEQVARMQQEVKVEREEKQRLAEGVKALASKSGELTQEIRENRPLAANTIFNDFLTNRVQAVFSAARAGAFGIDSNRRKETETVLVSDGTNAFALCHVQDTPLNLWTPGIDWESLNGSLSHNGVSVPIHSLSFYLRDPRIVLMPVSQTEARQLGSKIYRISPTPFKFADAVLVGTREGYYGECKFEIDPATPDYVRLDRSVLRGLFGKFNPSRGDLVFSRTGELLGVMANGSYCLMLQKFDAAASFPFGKDLRAQHTGEILSQLYGMVSGLPFKLQ